VVGVEVEHRARPNPPPFTFELPGDQQDVIRLTFAPGSVADLRASGKVDEVVEVVRQYPDGLCAREVRAAVPGDNSVIDAALKLAEEQGRLRKGSERRPDRRGHQRQQTVWRPTVLAQHT
jgi:hypothetical protein